MEGHRARMPFCMGSLFWQINDCWPVASWSSIDYFGRWKAQQYFARKSFARELVTSYVDGDAVKVSMVSDRLTDQAAILTLRVMDFRGTPLKTIELPLTLKANSNLLAFAAPTADLLGAVAPETVLMHAGLTAGDDVLAEDLLYFRPVKDLVLPQASLSTTVKNLGDAFAIGVSSPVLVKNLCLSFDDIDGVFSDNYFDLLPGRAAVVRFKPAQSASAKALKSDLQVMHMALVV